MRPTVVQPLDVLNVSISSFLYLLDIVLFGTSTFIQPTTAKMGYPETFEGYMISDQSKWTDFEKKEVQRNNVPHLPVLQY